MKENNITHWAINWLLDQGLSQESADTLTMAIDVVIVISISLLADFIARKIILRVVTRYVKHSKNNYDDILLEKRVFNCSFITKTSGSVRLNCRNRGNSQIP